MPYASRQARRINNDSGSGKNLKGNDMQRKLGTVICAGILICSNAYGASVIDNYNSRTKAAQVIEPMTVEDFGQSVNLQDGGVSFRTTDVVVQTNSGPITFGRKLSPTEFSTDELGSGTDFSSMPATPWELDIPYMTGIFAAGYGDGWPGSNWSNDVKRCTYLGELPTIYGVGTFSQVAYRPEYYFSGISINVPGHGMESVKESISGTASPQDGRSYVGTTPSHWKISCLDTLKNGRGEGFRVTLPNGTIYHFNWFAKRFAGNINDSTCSGASQNIYRSPESALATHQGCWVALAVPRMQSFLYATEVIDRFGNKTEYKFDADNPFHLSSIVHNGETVMSFGYSGGRLVQVSSFGRTWTYAYEGNLGSLSTVTNPDGSSWGYEISNNLRSINWYRPLEVWANCRVNIGTKSTSVAPGYDDASYVSIRSPSGATAKFDLRKILHGTNHGEARCYYQHIAGGGGADVGPIVPYPSVYQMASLYKMTVSGPGLSTYVRNYSYEPGWTSPYEARTVVSDSTGKFTRYKFGFAKMFGKVIEEESGAGSTVLRRISYKYLENAANQNFPEYVGIQLSAGAGMFDGHDNLNVPLIEKIEWVDGVNHTWRVRADCGGRYCFDGFIRPLKIDKASAPQ